MAYSDFTLLKVERELGVTHSFKSLIQRPVKKIEPSQHLKDDLAEAMEYPLSSEKSKSEFLITPILRELRKQNHKKFSIFSGFTFDVAPEKGLTGVCDYILGEKPDAAEIRSPIFCMVEAKNRTIEEGYGQCAAEMYAARLFNQESEKQKIYGAITNGYEWNFACLDAEMVIIDNNRFFINDLPELLGALQTIVDDTM
jgi:hypothetical protein